MTQNWKCWLRGAGRAEKRKRMQIIWSWAAKPCASHTEGTTLPQALSFPVAAGAIAREKTDSTRDKLTIAVSTTKKGLHQWWTVGSGHP